MTVPDGEKYPLKFILPVITGNVVSEKAAHQIIMSQCPEYLIFTVGAKTAQELIIIL